MATRTRKPEARSASFLLGPILEAWQRRILVVSAHRIRRKVGTFHGSPSTTAVTQQMRLRIVTPTLGRSPWLVETVKSVGTRYPGSVHVLVAPKELTEALAKTYPGCEVIAESISTGGLYAAINDGLSGGGAWDAFTYINDDDVLRPGFSELLRQLETTRGAAMLYGRVELIDGMGRRLGRIPVSARPTDNRTLYAQRLEPVYQHGTVVTREAWDQVGGFDASLRLCGDSEYLARLCLRGVHAEFVPATVAAFRLHGAQLTKRRRDMIAERALVDARLRLLDSPKNLRARLGFRLSNLPVYAERVLRHGWISFDELLERAGRDQNRQE